jgi:hypothetical protein
MDLGAAANVDDLLLGARMCFLGGIGGTLVAVIVNQIADLYHWVVVTIGFVVACAVSVLLWVHSRKEVLLHGSKKNTKIYVSPIKDTRLARNWNPTTMKKRRIKIGVINKAGSATAWRRGMVEDARSTQKGKQLIMVEYDDGEIEWVDIGKAKWAWDSSPAPSKITEHQHKKLLQLY